MKVRLLFICGYGMRAYNWSDEAEYVRQHVNWIDDVLVQTGNPLGSYQQRSMEILAGLGDRIQPEDHLIIIAHSFGGVIARYMASRRLLTPAAIITIATPHYGVQHADFYLRVTQQLPLLGPIIKGGYTLLTRVLGADDRAIEQLSTVGMQAFNDRYADHPDAVYHSYGCVAERVSLWLWPMFTLLSAYSGLPNDGLIALPSTRWGMYMDTITCDHNEVVGWSGPNNLDSARLVVDMLDRLPEEIKAGQRVVQVQ